MLLITLFSDEYRYGFNGMEKDDEIKNEGNSYDFGARMYDSRIGRWLSRDALEVKYPFVNPYNFSINNPILFKDYDGNDIIITNNGEEFRFSSSNAQYVGENDFINKTVQALNHLISYEGESNVKHNIITQLANDKTVEVYVEKCAITEHPKAVNAAQWNPKQITLIKDSGTGNIAPQNAASTLLHEIGHKYDELFQGVLSKKEPGISATDEEIDLYMDDYYNSQYDNKSEEAVIVNLETPYLQFMGQPTREDHDTFGFVETVGDFKSNEICITCNSDMYSMGENLIEVE